MIAASRWACLIALFISGGLARGYAVGPPIPIEDLASQADVIFQGRVVASNPVANPDFAVVPGFIEQETEFQFAWPIKGGLSFRGDVKFRHYATDPNANGRMMYAPQNYNFEAGKSYLVFAKQPAGSPPDTCQQMWMNQKGMEDEGVLLSFGDAPLGRRQDAMKDLFWSDLTELLKSSDPKDVVYAIQHLDQFSVTGGSMGRFFGLSIFQHLDVLEAVHGLIGNPDSSIAQEAIGLIGSHNPYMTRERAQYWLATVGSGDTEGLEKMDPRMANTGGLIYWRELAAVVEGKADDATRALAVTGLGLVREPSLQESVTRWLADSSPRVRSAVVLLLADYPALATHDRMVALAGDADAETRISAAFAIGFGQFIAEAAILGKLMTDPDAKVRQAASMSLLSFSPKDDRIAPLFGANLSSKEFGPLFLVALAQEDPGRYLDQLTGEVETKADPTNWQGGQIPAYTASHLLYQYIEKQPVADLQAGKFDRQFNALEIMQPNYSDEPASVYSLELRSGLIDRAKKFRAAADKASTYDLEPNFKRADADPKTYDN